MKFNFQKKHIPYLALGLAFVAAWAFFQFVYPSHLIRREQQTLFLFDWSYISQTYRRMGCLARLAGDFIDQFLFLPVIGPAIISAILTLIGTVSYRICRRFSGMGWSLGVAALVFLWSFMRETGNLFLTQYSLVTLGYLSLVLLALQFRKIILKAFSAALLLCLGIYALGSPYHHHYGLFWQTPNILDEKVVALDIATGKEDWDKVLKLSEDDLYANLASYMYNLAIAKKNMLGNSFFNHSQNYTDGLFLWVAGNNQFVDSVAGEVWYQLGDMTLAEQSAVVALQQSPKHNGARYIRRLACITLITGEYEAAQKYLNLLSKTLRYRKWAHSMMPGNHDARTKAWLEDKRSCLPEDDLIYGSNNQIGDVLRNLLKANPDNMLARQYLLMFDLLRVRIEDFMTDYTDMMISGSIYEQAVTIWLNIHNIFNEEQCAKYGVGERTLQRLQQFYRFPERYDNTYWYYYMDLTTPTE